MADENTLPQEGQQEEEEIPPILYGGQEWYNTQQAALILRTTPKYVRTLATHEDYRLLRYHKLSERNMLVLKADVLAYKVNQGKPGRRKKTGEPGQRRKTEKQHPRGGYSVSAFQHANTVTLANARQ
jgi:hypothetical protein